MHELPIIESAMNIALRHAETAGATKIVRIRLRVGALTELVDEWMQHYFSHLAKGTKAADAVLEIQWTPVVFRCADCEKTFSADIKKIDAIVCPRCAGANVALLSGREFFVKDIEVA